MSLHDPHRPRPAFAPSMYDDLDDIPAPDPHTRARSTDPDTSHAAARENAESGAGDRQRLAVLAAVRSKPGMTSDELAASIHVDRHIPGRRLSELEHAGLVRRGEARKSELTGRDGLTWFPVEGAK